MDYKALIETIRLNLKEYAEKLAEKIGFKQAESDWLFEDLWDRFKVQEAVANQRLHDWVKKLKDSGLDTNENRDMMLAQAVKTFGLDPIRKPHWWDASEDLTPEERA